MHDDREEAGGAVHGLHGHSPIHPPCETSAQMHLHNTAFQPPVLLTSSLLMLGSRQLKSTVVSAGDQCSGDAP